MTHQNSPDFYLIVEEFIFKAVEENTLEDHHLNNEIAMYLLSLLSDQKKQELL